MRFLALASDYDGTLAHKEKIAPTTLNALCDFRRSGRKLVLVTGRELHELLAIFPEASIFDSVVVENGALLYYPSTKAMRMLTHPPLPEFVEALRQKRVKPLSVGLSIVATSLKHEPTVVKTILEMELDLHVILNKGAVMVLPTGVNKGTGLTAALAELGIATRNVVGIGDAENDDSFLSLCGFSVAVANAIPRLKRLAHKTTQREHGAGVAEILQQIMQSDRA